MRNIANKTKALKNKFKSLFKGIPIPTYSWQKIDEDLILIDYNDAAEIITKGMIKNYVGMKASEMYKNQPEILEELFRCANDRISIFREMKYDYKSTGEERFVSVMYGFIPPDLVIVHTEDITEKKEVLERLKISEAELKVLNEKLKYRIDSSEEQYRAIFENTGTATLILEEDTTISLVNGHFEELSGYSREEIEWKKVWSEFVVKEDLERMKKLHYSRRIDPESTLKKYEFRFINKEGNIRNILIVIDMIPGTKKSIASLLDITERKKIEEKLKDSEEKARYLIDGITSVGIGIDIITKDYKILFQNQILKEKFGDITGKFCYENYMGLKAPCDFCPMIKALKNNTIESTELIGVDGNNYEIFSAPYLDSDRNTVKVIEIIMNITRRKQAERALWESEEKYRGAFNRAEFYKDIFAHDINNILQCILSGMEVNQLILEKPEKLEDLKINDNIIREQVIRGTKLVSNVRKLSQLEDIKQDLEKIEILNVLENTISLIKKSYKVKKMAFQIDTIEEILFIKANAFINDVFDNLLINAIDHNINPIIEITIKISKEQQNDMNYLKIEFLDNGIGVEDTMKGKILKRGYNEENSVLGMGLGLSLVQRIIETYNGKIWVEDRVKGDRSKGSNFVLLIPEVD